MVRFPLSCLWIYIISENKGAEQDIGDLLSTPTPTAVILPDPGTDPELPQWLYPNPGRGRQGRHCSVCGLLHGGVSSQILLSSWLGLYFLAQRKKKKPKQQGFPLFHFIVSFWARLWAFLRKTVNCPIKSSHHKATRGTACERFVVLLLSGRIHQPGSISPEFTLLGAKLESCE